MKKRIVLLFLIIAAVAGLAWAGGGKNQIQHHGDIGQGCVEQHQVRINL